MNKSSDAFSQLKMWKFNREAEKKTRKADSQMPKTPSVAT